MKKEQIIEYLINKAESKLPVFDKYPYDVYRVVLFEKLQTAIEVQFIKTQYGWKFEGFY